MIGNARQSKGLYYFEDRIELKRQAQSTCFKSISLTSENEIMLWHFRLGHPNFHYLKYLFPSLFKNKNPSFFQCEICELAKYHMTAFPLKAHKSLKPFSVIHSDVGRPSRINTMSSKRWFITFIDEHAWVGSVYQLKEKFEAEQVFKTFTTWFKDNFKQRFRFFKVTIKRNILIRFWGKKF